MGAYFQIIFAIFTISRLGFAEIRESEAIIPPTANCSAPEVAHLVTVHDMSDDNAQRVQLRCPPFHTSEGGSILKCTYNDATQASEWTPDPLQFICEYPCNVPDLPEGLAVTPNDPVIWSGEDIYFTCTEGILPKAAPQKSSCMNGTWTSPIPSCNLEHGKIRLKNGRVMVTYGEVEGSICFTDEWDIHNANVVCRQLGRRPYALSVTRIPIGSSNDLIHFDSVRCQGYEEKLIDCGLSFSPCNTRYYAGVECLEGDESASEGTVRLIEVGEGKPRRFEVHLDGVWGAICAIVCNDEMNSCSGQWSLERTNWFCQQLGFPAARGFTIIGKYAQPGYPTIYLSCPEDSEESIDYSSESSFDIDSCTHYFLGENVPCQYGALHGFCKKSEKFSLRLINGSSEDVGRLEIYDGDHWRTVPPFKDAVTPALICERLTGGGDYIQEVDGAFGNGLVMPKYTYSCPVDASSLSECDVVEVDDDVIDDGPVSLYCNQETTATEVAAMNPQLICYTAFACSLAVLFIAVVVRIHYHRKRTLYHRMNSYKFQYNVEENSSGEAGEDDDIGAEIDGVKTDRDDEPSDVVFDD